METGLRVPEDFLADALAHDRIRRHTPAHVNEKIDRVTYSIVEERAAAGRDAVVLRLKELDHEWDVDRALMANFAIVGAVTHTLGEHHHRGWMYFFRAQQAFLLLHAVVGWCPPMALFRRLGFRSSKEIAAERAELLARLDAVPAAAE